MRHQIGELVEEARFLGARLKDACQIIGLSVRTYQRWAKNPNQADKRAASIRVPKNKLTLDEKQKILHYCLLPEFVDQSPRQIVPRLADQGI